VALPVVGAHSPTVGGLAKSALSYVDRVGATTLQVYVSNSRGWALSSGDPEQDRLFLEGIEKRAIPAYIHASLLVNLGSPTPATVEHSIATLRHALIRGRTIGATGVVFHAGSAVTEEYTDKALHQVREALLPLLDETQSAGGPRLHVEPSAGGGRCLAARIDDLGPYLDAVERHPALGVCFDTCHIWAAGHDLASPGGMTSALDLLLDVIGPDRLALVHANDSKDECGSRRDRHENIGAGTLGTAAFAELFAHPATRGIPVIVETPSEGPTGTGHARDIATLLDLAATAPRRRRAGSRQRAS
jgi:deoxyribonuclease IV